MDIKSIVAIESLNKECTYLYKEGIFWRAYEISAYLFVSYVKAYQAIKKYYKVVNAEVVYVGFPATVVDDIKVSCLGRQYIVEHISEKEMIINGNFDSSGYDQWKENVFIQEKNEAIGIPNIATEKSILREIASYPLALKTPVEAQQFLYDIQKRIDGHLR